MNKTLLVGLALVFATGAVAQPAPPPDIPTLQKAIAIIQAQRNQAFDAQAGAEVRAATLAEEVARLKAQVRALEAKLPGDAGDR